MEKEETTPKKSWLLTSCIILVALFLVVWISAIGQDDTKKSLLHFGTFHSIKNEQEINITLKENNTFVLDLGKTKKTGRYKTFNDQLILTTKGDQKIVFQIVDNSAFIYFEEENDNNLDYFEDKMAFEMTGSLSEEGENKNAK